jgi:cytochrome c oxidase assembly protein subunit 17
MGNEQAKPKVESKPAPVVGKSGKKICCSCPETKEVRDLCVVTKGEENCADVIEAHKKCLREEGFDVK